MSVIKYLSKAFPITLNSTFHRILIVFAKLSLCLQGEVNIFSILKIILEINVHSELTWIKAKGLHDCLIEVF